MIKYESLKDLFMFLNFKDNPQKILFIDFSSWDMAMILCEIVECNMREVLSVGKYISISIDEVFAIHNIN
jgi:hypothetical protein